MKEPPLPVERYELGSFSGGGHMFALRAMPPGEPRRLGPLFAGIDPWKRYGYRGDALAAYLAGIEKTAPRIAIVSGNDVAGALALRLNWLRGPYLQFLGILPAYQGKGLGGAVLSWLEREARLNGETNVWVCTSDFNAGAARFYEQHGFVQTALIDDLVTDGIAERLMRKTLG